MCHVLQACIAMELNCHKDDHIDQNFRLSILDRRLMSCYANGPSIVLDLLTLKMSSLL